MHMLALSLEADEEGLLETTGPLWGWLKTGSTGFWKIPLNLEIQQIRICKSQNYFVYHHSLEIPKDYSISRHSNPEDILKCINQSHNRIRLT